MKHHLVNNFRNNLKLFSKMNKRQRQIIYNYANIRSLKYTKL
jgi:hypothetical protein